MKSYSFLNKRSKSQNNKLKAFKSVKGFRFVYKKQLPSLSLKQEEAKQLETEKMQLDEAEQAVESQKTKKSKITSFVAFCINIIVVAAVLMVQLKQDGIISVGNLVGFKVNYWFLVLAFLLFALLMFIKSTRINILIKQATKRSRPFLSYKVAALGRYYDSVTPMATGGQPFQIYYLSKRGLPASCAISVPLAKYFVAQISWITISIVAVMYSIINNSLESSKLVFYIAIISFIINILFISIMILLSVSKKIGKKLIVKTLKLLEKLHFIKNYEKQYNKVIKMVEDYQISMRSFLINKGKFIILLILSLIITFVTYSIPFLLYGALVEVDFSIFFDIFFKAVMIDVATSLIPLPGGTGMSEFSFAAVFASLFVDGTLFWAMLLWRLLTFYAYIIQGLCVLVYDYFVGNKKYNWQKKKWELENESLVFKNKQLERYKRRKKV